MKQAPTLKPDHAASCELPAVSADSESSMRERISNYDWASSPLGPMDSWSPTLRTALDLCLGSRMCSCIYWGPDHLIIYNDAYSSILGAKHPEALGRDAASVWHEIFDVLGPDGPQLHHR